MLRAGGTAIGAAGGAVCEEDRGRAVADHGVMDGVGVAEVDGCRALVDWAFGNREVWGRVERLWLDPDLVEDV